MEHGVTRLTLAAVLPNSLIVHNSFGFRHMPGYSTTVTAVSHLRLAVVRHLSRVFINNEMVED